MVEHKMGSLEVMLTQKRNDGFMGGNLEGFCLGLGKKLQDY